MAMEVQIWSRGNAVAECWRGGGGGAGTKLELAQHKLRTHQFLMLTQWRLPMKWREAGRGGGASWVLVLVCCQASCSSKYTPGNCLVPAAAPAAVVGFVGVGVGEGEGGCKWALGNVFAKHKSLTLWGLLSLCVFDVDECLSWENFRN